MKSPKLKAVETPDEPTPRNPRNSDEVRYELQNIVTCAQIAASAVENELITGEDADWAVQAIAGTLERAVLLLRNPDGL